MPAAQEEAVRAESLAVSADSSDAQNHCNHRRGSAAAARGLDSA